MADLAAVLQPHVECCICMCVLYNASSCTPCLHTFCAGCVCRWRDSGNRECPVCRHPIHNIHVNRAARDLVDSYLSFWPAERRTETDRESMDRAELEYLIEQLGRTDRRLMHVDWMAHSDDSSNRFDEKYKIMLERACQLVKMAVEKKNPDVSPIAISQRVGTLVTNLSRDVVPGIVEFRYYNLEIAYRKLLRLSMPMIGPELHSELGNQMFSADRENLEYVEKREMKEDLDQKVPRRVARLIEELERPDVPRLAVQKETVMADAPRRSARLAARNQNH